MSAGRSLADLKAVLAPLTPTSRPVVRVVVDRADDVDVKALRDRLPTYALRYLDAEVVDGVDRSEALYALAAVLVEEGLGDVEIRLLAETHAPSVDKADDAKDPGKRLDDLVGYALSRLRPEHDHVGRRCVEAGCAKTPQWQTGQAQRERDQAAFVDRHRQARRDDDQAAGVVDDHVDDAVPVRLPESFWSARPMFEHVRQAARSRLVAPDAVLAAVLAHVCVRVDRRWHLPPVVGRVGSLNNFLALVGPSGAGKGSALDCAEDLLGRLPPDIGNIPAGSGEGLVKAFFGSVTDSDGGKPRKVPKQTKTAVLLRIDEGEVLQRLGQRQGQTLFPMLRQAWSGERIGNSYADETKNLSLPAHGYRLATVMAVQPDLGKFLLDDVAGGTPQRFLWAPTIDPDAPEPDEVIDWPGRLDWEPLGTPTGPLPTPDGWPLGLASRIERDVRSARQRQVRGDNVDPLDTHLPLARLKVAALLAVLEGRADVNVDDWELAGVYADTSTAVREAMAATIRDTERHNDAAMNARRARTAEVVTDVQLATKAAHDALARRVADKVHKAGDAGVAKGNLQSATNSTSRVKLPAAIAAAMAAGWIVESTTERGTCYLPGPSKPGGST
jgi:hypothetical protein